MIIGLIIWVISTMSTHRIKMEMVRQGMDPNTYNPEVIVFTDED